MLVGKLNVNGIREEEEAVNKGPIACKQCFKAVRSSGLEPICYEDATCVSVISYEANSYCFAT